MVERWAMKYLELPFMEQSAAMEVPVVCR